MDVAEVRARFGEAYATVSRAHPGLPPPQLTKPDEQTHLEIAAWRAVRANRDLQVYLGSDDEKPFFWFKSVGKGLVPSSEQRRLLVVKVADPVRDVGRITTLARMWIKDGCAEIVAINFMKRWTD
jgi:hypothetical protein